MEVHDGCEYCGESGSKTYVDGDGKFHSMCTSCSSKNSELSECKACKIGCLFDNYHMHGLCEQCCELIINSKPYQDLVLATIRERKEEYDTLILKVNKALGLPAKEDTFETFGEQDDGLFLVFADKMMAVELQNFKYLYARTSAFYMDVMNHAVEMCLDKKPNSSASAKKEAPKRKRNQGAKPPKRRK